MADLNKLVGKTIKSIEEDFDGENSFLIMKFEEGGKLHCVAYSSSEEGTGQLSTSVYENQHVVPESLTEYNSYSEEEEDEREKETWFKKAEEISKADPDVSVHVNKSKDGEYYIDDWYDANETIATFVNGEY